MKHLIIIIIAPLCVLSTSSCYRGCCNEKEEVATFHPMWSELNELENNLDSTKCTFTKLGIGGLRFHVTDHQQLFNSIDFCSKSKENVVQTDISSVNWVLTPHFYGSVTKEKFPKTIKEGMKYKSYNDKEGGIPLSFLSELLAIDDYTGAVLIISKGVEGKLGVSDLLRKELKDKKDKGIIQDYIILRSGEAVKRHNKYVKEGKKVFTFIHTIG